MRVRGAGATDQGNARDNNEDSFLVDVELGLFVVCDGMGGHAAGEVASAMAAEAVRETVAKRAAWLASYEDGPAARQELVVLASSAIQNASAVVYEKARSSVGRAGMGTTVSLALVMGSVAVIGHVGDSRVYLLRQRELHQLSEDHTFLAEFIRGGLSLEKARKSRMGHRLTRAVGLQETVQVDTVLVDLLMGDRLLLCSDGLVGHIDTPAEIGPLLLAGSVSSRPRALVDFGVSREGSDDNITAVAVAILPDNEPTLRERTHEQHIILKLEALRHIWLFEHLTLREKSHVLSKLRDHHVAAGVAVIEEDTRGDSLFLVVDGQLEVIQGGSVVNVVEAGAHFGEMALMTQQPRSATVRAVTPSRLLEMHREDFAQLINNNTQLGVKLLSTMTRVLIERLARRAL